MTGSASLAGVFAEPLGRSLAGRLPWEPSGALPTAAAAYQTAGLTGTLAGAGALSAKLSFVAANRGGGSADADAEADVAQTVGIVADGAAEGRPQAAFQQKLPLAAYLRGAAAIAAALTEQAGLSPAGEAQRRGVGPLAGALGLSGTLTNAAASGVSEVQVQSASSSTNISSLAVTLSAVEGGDVIIAVLDYSSSESTWTFNCTDGAANTYTQVVNQAGGQGATQIVAFAATAGAAAANLVVTASITGHDVLGLWTVYQLRGGTAPTAADCVAEALISIQPAGTTMTSPGFAADTGAFVVAAGTVYINAATPTLSPITPSAGTYAADASFAFSVSVELYCGNVTGMGAQTAATVTWTPNPTTDGWRGTCAIIPVNPS